MTLKQIAKRLSPPILSDAIRSLLQRNNSSAGIVEWEYVPEGWKSLKNDPKVKGWNVSSVLEAYRQKWPQFLESVQGVEPFGLSPEADGSSQTDLPFHNILMTYGYALGVSTRHKDAISLLDWGGGIGHYYVLSRALLSGLQIDYHCKDVPCLAEYGQILFPEAHFYSDESCFDRKYDFVLASTSLHYSQDWADTLAKLANVTTGFLFVTQLPIVHQSDSYVFVQRPYQYGYDTEYIGWCLNRNKFLDRAKHLGLQLIREFVVGHQPIITNAPEQCEYRGFLFKAELRHSEET